MCPSDNGDTPIVEPTPQSDGPDLAQRALQQRIRQQEILAKLGVTALQGASFDRLLADTARLTAEGLRAEFCKVLEHIPSENRFLVRAGVGWSPGIVGVASVGADLASPAGFALRTGKPVISNHLENEERFRTPDILQQHGIHRAMNVILQGEGRPFGVLEVDSRSEDEFEEHDLAFLQGAANILGMAIERDRHERSLKAALERQQFLLKETNHRVKNSLTIVASMLHLQARDIDDPNLTRHLDEASNRVAAVARAHDQLYQGFDIERMDIGKYIETVCKDLDAGVSQYDIHTHVDYGIEISADRAISAALIVNELITNAVKYAYQGQSGGKIWVTVARLENDSFSISVRDEGAGLPSDFDPRKAKGLGMRIVRSFSQQLNGAFTFRTHDPGAEFIITIPRQG
ncbi:MAG: histidine kinase dimerization/phosphoacceptor domain -containing protein [Methylocella sp.]